MRRRAFLRLSALLALCGRHALDALPVQAQEDDVQEWVFPLAFPAYFSESPTITEWSRGSTTSTVYLPFLAN